MMVFCIFFAYEIFIIKKVTCKLNQSIDCHNMRRKKVRYLLREKLHLGSNCEHRSETLSRSKYLATDVPIRRASVVPQFFQCISLN